MAKLRIVLLSMFGGSTDYEGTIPYSVPSAARYVGRESRFLIEGEEWLTCLLGCWEHGAH